MTDVSDGVQEELEVIRRASMAVLGHRCYVLGPEVQQLEVELAAMLGTRHAIGCNSGFGAHLLSLLALDIGTGSRVLVTPFSPSSFAGAVVRRGATVVLVDVAPEDFHLDTTQLIGPLRDVDAVVVHHLFGGAADMAAICSAAGSIPVMEVVTYSFGARLGGRWVGTFGSLATCCLREETTFGAYGDAGMVWTNDPELAARLCTIRAESGWTDVYDGIVAGNFHMDTIHAAILLRRIHMLDAVQARRRHRAGLLVAALAAYGIGNLVVPDLWRELATRFVVLAPERDQLYSHLRSRGIAAEPWWPVPLHLQPGLRSLGYARGDFPNAERVSRMALHLPLPGEEQEAERLASELAGFYGS